MKITANIVLPGNFELNYGYMQFKQFMLIYEDKNLPDFDTFVTNYIRK